MPIVLLFNLGCSAVYKGQVVSEHDSIPLENVTITLQNYNCMPSIVVNTSSDKNGNFELHIPAVVRKCINKKVSIYLTKENYKPIFYELGKADKNTIIKMPR